MILKLFQGKQMAENNGEKVTVASKFRWCPGFGWNTANRYALGFSFRSVWASKAAFMAPPILFKGYCPSASHGLDVANSSKASGEMQTVWQ